MTAQRSAHCEGALEELRLALGAQAVVEGTSGSAVLVPAGREPARMAAAVLAESRVPWTPRGAGRSEPTWGEVQLDSSGLADVYDLWREDLVCRAGAGCRLASLQALLARERMRVPAHAAHPARATLAGIFAGGERGLRSGPAGGLREAVIGLTALDGRGQLMKAGARVVKNVAGFDLARLHHGARGALGMILDVTLKLEPLPEATAGVVFEADLPSALQAMSELRRPQTALDPVGLVWLNAAAAAGLGLAAPGVLLAVVEGWAASVCRWVEHAAQRGGRRDDTFEPRVRDLEWADAPGFSRWRWLAAPSCVLRTWPAAEVALERAGAGPRLAVDLLNGHATLALAGTGAVSATQRALGELLRTQGEHGGGGCVLEAHGGGLARQLRVPERPANALEVRLKQAFDPHGLLPPLPLPLEVRR